ncbi:MAG: hypothetical protein WA940_06180 [Sphingopyxis sp.]
MTGTDELSLNERLGLLRTVCEQQEYLDAGDVTSRELALDVAAERYGADGVPAAGAIIFQCWGDQPIVAGMLTAPEQSAALPYIRCAAVAQQSLGARSVDMLVLLIGPQGSSDRDEWAIAAAAIEDDDRICRKMVWLPDRDPRASAEQFLQRSPFARPWRHAVPFKGQVSSLETIIGDDELDDLALQADAVGASAADFLKEALLRSLPE